MWSCDGVDNVADGSGDMQMAISHPSSSVPGIVQDLLSCTPPTRSRHAGPWVILTFSIARCLQGCKPAIAALLPSPPRAQRQQRPNSMPARLPPGVLPRLSEQAIGTATASHRPHDSAGASPNHQHATSTAAAPAGGAHGPVSAPGRMPHLEVPPPSAPAAEPAAAARPTGSSEARHAAWGAAADPPRGQLSASSREVAARGVVPAQGSTAPAARQLESLRVGGTVPAVGERQDTSTHARGQAVAEPLRQVAETSGTLSARVMVPEGAAAEEDEPRGTLGVQPENMLTEEDEPCDQRQPRGAEQPSCPSGR